MAEILLKQRDGVPVHPFTPDDSSMPILVGDTLFIRVGDERRKVGTVVSLYPSGQSQGLIPIQLPSSEDRPSFSGSALVKTMDSDPTTAPREAAAAFIAELEELKSSIREAEQLSSAISSATDPGSAKDAAKKLVEFLDSNNFWDVINAYNVRVLAKDD